MRSRLSSGALAEEEGLDSFVVIFKEMAMNNFQFLLYVSGCIVRSMSDLQYFKIPNKFVREIGIFSQFCPIMRRVNFNIERFWILLGSGGV